MSVALRPRAPLVWVGTYPYGGSDSCHQCSHPDRVPYGLFPSVCICPSSGCGTPDTDTDLDGTPDCNDACASDPSKTAPGVCGCGVTDADADADGTLNCNDTCPNDAGKVAPGVCGCGTPDDDSDGDGVPNCLDNCDDRIDSDGDGTPDCVDSCPADAGKVAPGECGCGSVDTDADSDGVAVCNDGCDADASKVAPGIWYVRCLCVRVCGCAGSAAQCMRQCFERVPCV